MRIQANITVESSGKPTNHLTLLDRILVGSSSEYIGMRGHHGENARNSLMTGISRFMPLESAFEA